MQEGKKGDLVICCHGNELVQSWWFELCLELLRRGWRKDGNIYIIMKPKSLQKYWQVLSPLSLCSPHVNIQLLSLR